MQICFSGIIFFYSLLVGKGPVEDNLFMFPSLPLMVLKREKKKKKNLYFHYFWLHWKMVYWGCPGLHLVMLPLLKFSFLFKKNTKLQFLSLSLCLTPKTSHFSFCFVRMCCWQLLLYCHHVSKALNSEITWISALNP